MVIGPQKAALCICITETMEDSPLTRINFQPSGAQCEIYLYTTFQGGNGGLGWKMCGCMGIKQSAQSSKTELNILFRKPQRPDTDSAIPHKRGARIKTIHASGVEILPFCAANLPCKWAEHLYTATALFCNPGGFLSASYYVKKLKTEGIVDNELSCLFSHCCGGNNGVQESWQRYWWLHKQRQREEKCLKNWSINKHRMCLKNRTANMPREHRDGDITQRALFLWRCMVHGWALHQWRSILFFGGAHSLKKKKT